MLGLATQRQQGILTPCCLLGRGYIVMPMTTTNFCFAFYDAIPYNAYVLPILFQDEKEYIVHS